MISEAQATSGQIMQLCGFLAMNTDSQGIPRDVLQTLLQGKENQEQLLVNWRFFLLSGCRFPLGDLIVTPTPLDPTTFLGEGWSYFPEEHDSRNDSLTQVNLAQAGFLHCLKEGENSITGEEKLRRLKADTQRIRYGAAVFHGLWFDYQAKKGNSILERLYRERKITFLDFPGDVLRRPGGRRYVLYLYRDDRGWCWCADWLEYLWGAHGVSAVSQVAS